MDASFDRNKEKSRLGKMSVRQVTAGYDYQMATARYNGKARRALRHSFHHYRKVPLSFARRFWLASPRSGGQAGR